MVAQGVAKDELTEALDAQANRLTWRVAGMTTAMLAVAVALARVIG